MKTIFCCYCFFHFLTNNCFALFGGNREYNPHLSSVVLIEVKSNLSKISDYCTGTVISATLILTSGDCMNYMYDLPKILTNEIIVIVYPNYRKRSDSKNATQVRVVSYKVFKKPTNKTVNRYGEESSYKSSNKLYVFHVSPAIKLDEMQITPANLTKTYDKPKALIIAGYGPAYDDSPDDYFYGDLKWIKVTTFSFIKGLFKHKSIALQYGKVCWTGNEIIEIDYGDVGAAVLDENYNLIGLSQYTRVNSNNCYVKIFNTLKFLKKELRNTHNNE